MQRTPEFAYSIVRDWNKAQGMTHPSDEVYQVRRDIGLRRIAIENSSVDMSVAIAIEAYFGQPPLPTPQFTLAPGQIINLGVNSIGGPMQYIYMYDPQTNELLGTPAPLRTDSNSFVLREGLNKWNVQAFKTMGYRG